jgi:hypothetical protein
MKRSHACLKTGMAPFLLAARDFPSNFFGRDLESFFAK